MRPPIEAQATCVAGGIGSAPLAPPTSEGRHSCSPSPTSMKALPPRWRDIMFSTVAMKP